jgi:hypothetical protein
MKRCRGELWGEMMAGIVRIVREDEKGRNLYRYKCQKCGCITESNNPKRKQCQKERSDG